MKPKLLLTLLWFAAVTSVLLAFPFIATRPVALEGPQRYRVQQEEASTAAPGSSTTGQRSLSSLIILAAEKILAAVGIDNEGYRLYATWIVGVPMLVFLVTLLMLVRPRRKRMSYFQGNQRIFSRKRKTVESEEIRTHSLYDARKANLTDKQRVLRFFFQLFKHQIGAHPDVPAELFLVESRPTCPNETYEMRIQQNGDWISRRMSIGLLGQGGGSRSKCFYVIYDSHMVIKIPSDPITAFFNYNRQIATEAAVVARLAPRECIVPKVSVILKAIHTIPDSGKLSAEALEKKYIHLMEVKPNFQEYLKIGQSFAFFMDLAKYFFLSTTVEEIHSEPLGLADEALRHPELLWDQHSFTCRYGEEAALVCHELQEIYYRCENQLRNLVEKAAIIEDVPAFRLKQWFLIHLAGEKIDAKKEDLPDALVEQVNAMLTQTVKNHVGPVEKYRNNLKTYLLETRFSRQRLQLENLASNTLDLLAWIEKKGLALRDLKPENLFVAGNPDEYPLFLNDAGSFSIGLIDVETAVAIDKQDSQTIPQPQLAGTPLYATPTHLLSNTILLQIYPGLAEIFRLQDWHATIAIIFKIFTGVNLFPNTARVFPEILRRLKLIDPAGPHLKEEVIEISRLFWNSAQSEFKDALQRHKDVLERFEVAVPKCFIPELVKAMHREIEQMKKKIALAVAQQSIFSSRSKNQFLLEAEADKIKQMKNKLSLDTLGRTDKSRQHTALMDFLDHLEALKTRYERKLEAAAILKATGAPIAADQLLEAMFQVVFICMYPPSWPSLSTVTWNAGDTIPEAEIATYQATM